MNEAEEFSSTYIVNVIFNVLLCFTTILLNSITIHAMRKTSSLPKPLKVLLLGLAVSDLSVGLLVQPLYIALLAMGLEQTNRTTFNNTYFVLFIIATILAYASFFGVLALTFDRFLAIYPHLRYLEFVTYKRAVAVVISITMLSLFISSFPFWISIRDTLKIYSSIEITPCIIITTIVYCKIYLTVRRHRNQIQSLQQDEGQNREIMANVARLVKLAVGKFYVYLVFLVCYMPRVSLTIALHIFGTDTLLSHIMFYSYTMWLLNSSLNPLIYCWKMRDIRRAVINIMQNIFSVTVK